MKIPEIKKYINLYDQEGHLFNVVGPRIRERGSLTFDEFYDIGMWKSARQKQNYLKNQEVDIQKITKEAFAQKDERLKMKQLRKLKGVDIPTASAILTIVFPDQYAVIDVRCVEVLQGEKFDAEIKKEFGFEIKKSMTLKNWERYLDIMRRLAAENGVTPREMDKALFAMHRENLEKANHRNVYAGKQQ